MSDNIESDAYYIAEAKKLPRLSRWEQSFLQVADERVKDGIPLAPGQRVKLQQIIMERSQ